MSEQLDLVLRIVGLIAQISVPAVIFYAGRQLARAQYVKSTQDAWNEFNKLTILNDDNLRVSKESFGQGFEKDSDDFYRKAHIAFVALNAFMTIHYGTKHKLLPSDYRQSHIEQVMSGWLADDHIFELSQSRGYPEEFRDLCRRVRSDAIKKVGAANQNN